jgi:hypothetical protein
VPHLEGSQCAEVERVEDVHEVDVEIALDAVGRERAIEAGAPEIGGERDLPAGVFSGCRLGVARVSSEGRGSDE